MKRNFLLAGIVLLALASCTKNVDSTETSTTGKGLFPATQKTEFVKYTIQKGQQYSDKNGFKLVKYEQLKFVVKFDSSAIYTTANPANQNDINKLFGFSDNNRMHHEFSARFGWRWSNNALRLFAYVYNNSVVSSKEIGTVNIGAENSCSIKVINNAYIFSLNGNTVTMPRASTTPKGSGYKLYPYFGGDELAPHIISVSIKEL